MKYTYKVLILVLIMSMASLWIISCGKLGTADFGTIPTTDSGTTYSSISFSGIDNVTALTSTRVRIDWTHVDGAINYMVYNTTSGTPVYIADVDAPTATYEVSGLISTTTYKFRVNLVDQYLKIDSNTKDVSITTNTFSCPNDFGEYILVPHNDTYGINSDFCVAKYEMKCAADATGTACSGNPISQAANKPWVNIGQSGAAGRAKELCESLGDGYHLITNSEWMTIARNIETNTEYQDLNWSGGTVGSGHLARGWAASTNKGDTWTNTVVAPATSAACLYNTAANTCDSTGDHLYKRTHTLSNGEVIWDLSGNIWEWVDWEVIYTTLQSNKAIPPNGLGNAYREYYVDPASTTPTGSMPAISFEPTDNTLTSANGIGKYYPGNSGSGGAAIRGAGWNYGSSAGVFALDLHLVPSYASNNDVSFRCVYSE